ncbi:MAG: hypothetical protein WBF34_23725 [Streptosporangiaceae bacterium]
MTLRQANVFVAALDARRDLVPLPPAVRRPCSWSCGAARRAELPALHEAAAVLRAG